EVRLLGEAAHSCGSARVGDYLEADGVKQTEQLFEADSITLLRNGSHVHESAAPGAFMYLLPLPSAAFGRGEGQGASPGGQKASGSGDGWRGEEAGHLAQPPIRRQQREIDASGHRRA